ncbi:MAG: DUF1800 family protein [Rhodoferax sp.]|nr:DUF1800 family protein [Rhodoferax sp.]
MRQVGSGAGIVNEPGARVARTAHLGGSRGLPAGRCHSGTAKLLTGWTVNAQNARQGRLSWNALHQPGAGRELGKRAAPGPQAIDELLSDLVRHRSCADYVATNRGAAFVAR